MAGPRGGERSSTGESGGLRQPLYWCGVCNEVHFDEPSRVSPAWKLGDEYVVLHTGLTSAEPVRLEEAWRLECGGLVQANPATCVHARVVVAPFVGQPTQCLDCRRLNV